LVSLNPRKWGRHNTEQLNEQDHYYANNLFTSENGKLNSQVEEHQALGTNIHMIEDGGLFEQIESFCKYPQAMIIYESVVAHNQITGEPRTLLQPKTVESETIDWNMMSLRELMSKIIATRWISQADADIYKEEIEYAIEEIIENLSHDEFQRKAQFYRNAKFIILTAIDDAVNGRKARLLKVQLKGFELNVQHGQPSGMTGQGGG
jgi:hypothetical protein